MSSDPIANYNSPDIDEYTLTPGKGPHTTNGKTTQISDIVINAGGEDRDKPTEGNDSNLGQLRAKLTSLQDNINVFLTERMALAKDKSQQDDIERRILDDGVDEDDSD